MAQKTVTWTWDASLESWVATAGQASTGSRNTTDGNPGTGCLQMRCAGRSKTNNNKWGLTGTWASLFGLPTGSVITAVGVSGDGYNYKCSECYTGSNGIAGAVEIRTSPGGVLIATANTGGGNFSTTTGWLNLASLTNQPVAAQYQADTTAIEIGLLDTLSTAANSSAAITVLQDQLIITVVYTPPAGPTALDPVVKGSTSFTAKWTAVGGASAYKLTVRDQGGTPVTGYNGLNVGNVIKYRVAGLTSGAQYSFTVVAVIGGGDSAPSNSISLTLLSSWHPSDVSGLVGLWSADAITGHSDGDTIDTWVDASDSGNTVTQATAGKRPVYKVSITPTGKPILRFTNGSQTELANTSQQSMDSQNFSMFVVYKVASVSFSQAPLLVGAFDAGGRQLCQSDAPTRIGLHRSNVAIVCEGTVTTLQVGSWYAFEAISSGGNNHKVWLNGTLEDTDTGAVTWANGQGLYIGSKGNQRWLSGDVAVVLYYNEALSDSDRTALETYLQSTYIGASGAMQGVGAVTVTGSAAARSVARMAATGSITVVGAGLLRSVARLHGGLNGIFVAGSAVLRSLSRMQATASIPVTGTGAMNAPPSARMVGAGDIALSGTGKARTVVRMAAAGAIALSGSGALRPILRLAVLGNIAVPGSGTMRSVTRMIAPLNGIFLVGTGAMNAPPSARMVGAGNITLTGTGALSVQAPVASMVGAGAIVVQGTGSMRSVARMGVSGAISVSGSGALRSVVRLPGAGGIDIQGMGQMRLRQPLSGSGAIVVAGSGALSSRDPNLVVWTSDIHAASSDPGATWFPSATLHDFADHVASLNPSAVLITGDTRSRYGNESDAVAFRDNFYALALPQPQIVRGNHEADNNTTDPPSYAEWDGVFPAVAYHCIYDWQAPKIRFILFHAPRQITGALHFHLDPSEQTWIEGQVASMPVGWKALLATHPPVWGDAQGSTHLGCIDRDSGGQTLLDYMAVNTDKILGYFNGHQHMSLYTEWHVGQVHIWGPSAAPNSNNAYVRWTYEAAAQTITATAYYTTTPFGVRGFTPVVIPLSPLLGEGSIDLPGVGAMRSIVPMVGSGSIDVPGSGVLSTPGGGPVHEDMSGAGSIGMSGSGVLSEPASQPAPVFLSAGGDSTFDLNEFPAYTANSQILQYTTEQAHTGPGSYKFETTATPNTVYFQTPTLPDNTKSRMSVWVRFRDRSLDGASPLLKHFRWYGSFGLQVNYQGYLQLQLDTGTVLATGTHQIPLNEWHRISLAMTYTDTTHNEFRVWVDGQLDITVSNATLAGTYTYLRIGYNSAVPLASRAWYLDDLWLDSDGGLTDPGDIRVTAKLPNADGYMEWASGATYARLADRPFDGSRNATAQTTDVPDKRRSVGIQDAATGDVDLTGATLHGFGYWWAVSNQTAADTVTLRYNGHTSSFSTTSFGVPNFARRYEAAGPYPTGTDVVGIQTNATLAYALAWLEAGVLVAYTPAAGPTYVAMTGTGSIAVSGQATTRSVIRAAATGSIAVVGSGPMRAAMRMAAAGAIAVQGSGTARSLSRLQVSGNIVLSGSGALRSVVRLPGAGGIDIQGLGTMRVLGPLNGSGAIVVAGSGSMEGVAVRVDLAATGDIALQGQAVARSVIRAAATGSIAVVGSGPMRSAGRMAAAGAIVVQGAGTMRLVNKTTGTGAITVSGAGTMRSVGRLVATSGITLTGTGVLSGIPPGASMAGQGGIALAGVAVARSVVRMAGSGAIAVQGSGLLSVPTVGMAATGSIALAGAGTLRAAVRLHATGAIIVTGAGAARTLARMHASSSVTLTGAGTLRRLERLQALGSIALTGSGLLSIPTTGMTGMGSIGLSGQGSLRDVLRLAGAGSIQIAGLGTARSLVRLIGAGDIALVGSGIMFGTAVPADGPVPYSPRREIVQEVQNVLLVEEQTRTLIVDGIYTLELLAEKPS